MKKLYFIRHGLTEMNVAGLFAGSTETFLTEEGRSQAQAAGKAARALDIDCIVTSPQSRAHETAEIIAAEIGYPKDKILVHKDLRERHFGELEGTPWSPTYLDLTTVKDAETDDVLLPRVQNVLDWLKTLPADNILVVSHGTTGRALRSLLLEDYPMNHPEHLLNATIMKWFEEV